MYRIDAVKLARAAVACLAVGGCSMLSPPDAPKRAPPSGESGLGPAPALELAGIEKGGLYDRLRAGFALPPLDNGEVRYYESWYRRHPMALDHLADPGSWYLPYIEREVEKRDMPAEIALLPAVESGFDATATSPSGAAGLWQFTATTAQHFGLYQSDWLDQRRNLESSTRAALDYMEDLHRSFNGDWLLALAAYNAGEGTIKSLVRQNRQRGVAADFRRLPLGRETRHFVPKLIALRNVITDPARFGIRLPPIDDRVRFVRVDPGRQVRHDQIAAVCGVDPGLVTQINAGQLRRITPPSGPYKVRLPIECEPRFEVAEPSPAPPPDAVDAGSTYAVRAGDSLWRIARDHGVSLAALTHANPGKGAALMPGDQLLIPAEGSDTGETREIVHRVERGDTLFGLARRYQVSVSAIAGWNEIPQTSTLRLGQPLRIYPKP